MRKQRGFTIVELLIVIVVIGVLAAIIIISYIGISYIGNGDTTFETGYSARPSGACRFAFGWFLRKIFMSLRRSTKSVLKVVGPVAELHDHFATEPPKVVPRQQDLLYFTPA